MSPSDFDLPGVRVTFGLGLDGQSWPDPLGARRACDGELRTGPLGFLEFLETGLGLGGEETTLPIRVAQYRARLEEADGADRFYSRSLREDALAVARTLYGWREELLLAGWDGKPVGASKRTDDLAAVEAVEGVPLAPGFAERLQAVAANLAERRRTGRTPFSFLSSVELVEEPNTFPWLWQRVLDELKRSGVDVSRHQSDFNRATGDLGLLQAVLEGSLNTATAAGDGSLVLVTARSDIEAGEAVARWLTTNGDELVILNPGGDPLLDGVLHRLGRPSAGIAETSRFRPILQVLPLALALRWKPIDPARVLEFLSLPVSPLPRFAALRLAKAITESPGIGGVSWREALAAIEASGAARRGEAAGDVPELPRDSRSVLDRIRAWIEPERYSVVEDIPTAAVVATCGQVAQWLAARIARLGADPLTAAALAAATEAKRLAEEESSGRLTPVQLTRLVEAATRAGAGDPHVLAEVGHLPVLHSADAMLAPANIVVWWDFTSETMPAPHSSRWTASERSAIEAAGLRLQDPIVDYLRRTDDALRAVRASRHRLVLVAPSRRRGKEADPYPLWDRIQAAFGETAENLRIDASEFLGLESGRGADQSSLVVVPHRQLARPKRWWQLASGEFLGPRDVESYSSLDNLLNHPFLWVLKYKAKLRAGLAAGLIDGDKLLGNLSHRLLCEMLDDPSLAAGNEAALRRFFDERLDRVLEEDGAILLQPGRGRDRRRLLDRCVRAGSQLQRSLRGGGWRLLGTEYEVAGACSGGSLTGKIDVALENVSGRRALVDIKWGGRPYRLKSLRENAALQLALYGYLLRSASGTWPAAAYLIVDEPTVLATDPQSFPGALVPQLEAGTPADLWISVEPTWAWRRAQLDAGLIEMTDGTEPDERSQLPPECRLTAKDCRFNDYRSLIGFPEEEQP